MLPRRLLLSIALVTSISAQTFEVASINPNAAGDNRVMIRMQPGGRFTASGVTLKQLIGQAYNVRDFQISGGPGWMDSERYDINAKAEGLAERVPPEQLRPMLRALLEDRFRLKIRNETKELPIYALVVGKSGARLTPSAADNPAPMIRMGRGLLNASSMPLTMLAQQLSQQLGRSVIDKTGLTGNYEIKLEWTPEPGQGGGPLAGPPPPDAITAADSNGPTIFTALQEQLGLR
ncbi:MAG TPA: TIGR03435 family protein, partial [Bryobacteraceae bacterium]|nr:TIGR03435 family protein [Bryobacteraceae bacterium]